MWWLNTRREFQVKRECALTAQFGRLVAVVQTVIISVTFPAVLNTAVILTGELSRLTLRRGNVRRVGCGETHTHEM